MASQPVGPQIKAGGWTTGSALPAGLADNRVAALPQAIEALQHSGARVFVLSQECDVVAPSIHSEPYVECIVGMPIAPKQMAETTLRSLRLLDMTAQDGQAFRLQFNARLWLDRRALVGKSPIQEESFDSNAVRRLKRWCSRRYGRAAFPDALVERLGFYKKGSEGRRALEALAETAQQVRVSVKPHNQELEQGQAYDLEVLVILSAQRTEAHADDVVSLEDYLRACEGINLKKFTAKTPKEFSGSDLMNTEEWHLDDLTLSADPGNDEPAPGVGVGFPTP